MFRVELADDTGKGEANGIGSQGIDYCVCIFVCECGQ